MSGKQPCNPSPFQKHFGVVVYTATNRLDIAVLYNVIYHCKRYHPCFCRASLIIGGKWGKSGVQYMEALVYVLRTCGQLQCVPACTGKIVKPEKTKSVFYGFRIAEDLIFGRINNYISAVGKCSAFVNEGDPYIICFCKNFCEFFLATSVCFCLEQFKQFFFFISKFFHIIRPIYTALLFHETLLLQSGRILPPVLSSFLPLVCIPHILQVLPSFQCFAER